MTSATDTEVEPRSRALEVRWLLFTVTWAAAVLFHVAGNTRIGPAWGRALVGVAAIAVLARPRARLPVAFLAVGVLVSVWLEAPVLGNHWLLHGFIAVVVLGGLAVRAGSGAGVIERTAGPLRLLLLAFYAFAAFAKLNSDFFDPVVSCGRFYLEESAASWGFGSFVDGWSAGVDRTVAVAVAGIELAVPMLLAVRRTRSVGVLVALAFHFVLALDRTHQFFDFSSALVVLFLLFLPSDGVVRAVAHWERLRTRLARRWPSGPELLHLVLLAAVALVVVVAAGPATWPAPSVLRAVGVAAWVVYGGTTVLGAVLAVRSAEDPLSRLLPASSSRALMLISALAVVNGLLPYLEVKSAASWNMYSNLAVVDGESNHYVIRSGIPLTDAHERLVEVVAAEGVDLSHYIGSDWRLPEVMLLDHIADRPAAGVDALVDGERVRYQGGQGGARPTWQQKLQVFRAVDGAGPVSCQPSYGPAR